MNRIAEVMGALALAGACSGCGLLITQSPPRNHAQLPYFSCTESNAGPIIDLAMGALYGISALTYEPSDYSLSTADAGSLRATWGVMGAGMLVSGCSAVPSSRAPHLKGRWRA